MTEDTMLESEEKYKGMIVEKNLYVVLQTLALYF